VPLAQEYEVKQSLPPSVGDEVCGSRGAVLACADPSSHQVLDEDMQAIGHLTRGTNITLSLVALDLHLVRKRMEAQCEAEGIVLRDCERITRMADKLAVALVDDLQEAGYLE
jgi:hypothetical protein